MSVEILSLPHVCDLPIIGEYPDGTIIRCTSCGAQYRKHYSVGGMGGIDWYWQKARWCSLWKVKR